MPESNQNLHEVAITAIVVKDGKYLITRRSKAKKDFPAIGRFQAENWKFLIT